MRSICFQLLMLFLLCTHFLQAQESAYQWYKGNTHTHSYWSDGDDFPEMIMDWYKTNGYQFIALSDHNVLAEIDRWKQIPAHPFRQRRYREYVEKFGKDWVVSRTDSSGQLEVKLKMLREYAPLFEENGKFLILPAEEITDAFQGKPIHTNAINVREVIQPQGGNSVREVMQNNINAVYDQRKRTGQPMFPHLNHPNFGWAIKLEDMLELSGERFFEVYNGHPHVHNYGDSLTMGMEELWDRLLIHYIGQGKPLLYGLATDDAHNHLEYNTGLSNPGRGWIMVRAKALSAEAIIESMESGDFYSTTGVALDQVSFSGNTLSLEVKTEPGVSYTIQFWGADKASAKKGFQRKMLKEVKGSKASYTLRRKDLFVRAKIISSKPKENPFQAGDMETAWTQPLSLPVATGR